MDALRKEVQLRIERAVLLGEHNLDKRINLENGDLRSEADTPAEKMKRRWWGGVTFGGLSDLGAAVLGAEPLLDGALSTVDGAVGLGLASAIATTLSGLRRTGPTGYTAYATLAHQRFG